MHEEVNQKNVSFYIRGAKVTADVLKAAMRRWLDHQSRTRAGSKETVRRKVMGVQQGKQTLRELMSQNCELKNIEITDANIRSFDRIARKYGIDYSLKKDVMAESPRYLVFFKARDLSVMESAFREYAGVTLNKEKKASILKKLTVAKERVAQHRERTKQQQKDRGMSL